MWLRVLDDLGAEMLSGGHTVVGSQTKRYLINGANERKRPLSRRRRFGEVSP